MEFNQIDGKTTPSFSSTHQRLISFAFSAMLTSAFLATAPEGMIAAGAGPNIQAIFTQMQTSGFPGATSLSMPASVTIPTSAAANVPAAQPAAPLSNEQLQKIRRDVEERNKRFAVDPTATHLLGLTKKGDSLTLLARALKDRQGVTHSFYLLDGNAGYLVVRSTHEGIACLVDKNLNLLAAVKKPADGSGFNVLPLPEAAPILHAELLEWAKIADQVIGAKPKVAAASQP